MEITNSLHMSSIPTTISLIEFNLIEIPREVIYMLTPMLKWAML